MSKEIQHVFSFRATDGNCGNCSRLHNIRWRALELGSQVLKRSQTLFDMHGYCSKPWSQGQYQQMPELTWTLYNFVYNVGIALWGPDHKSKPTILHEGKVHIFFITWPPWISVRPWIIFSFFHHVTWDMPGNM
jgi:hypothetical protein